MTHSLQLDSLSVQMPGGLTALNQVSFSLPRGTVCALVGPNGAGKTTLLRALLGLERPTQGSCKIFGSDFLPGKTPVAYMPQRSDVDLDFPVTVSDVVSMGLPRAASLFESLSLSFRSGRRARLESILELVGLTQLAHRPLCDLSGGQRQRTFFARCLAQDAELFLLDEPFAGVDYETEQFLISHLRRLSAQGKTALIVHHDVTSVPRIFEHVILLNVGVFAAGRVEDVWSEQSLAHTFYPHSKRQRRLGEAGV